MIGASIVLIIFASVYIFFKCYHRRIQRSETEYHPNILHGRSTYIFSMEQIEIATGGFDPANKIGEGGFGSVYKVSLINSTLL